MHNITTSHEKLFAAHLNTTYMWYINTHGTQGIQHYAINSLLYLRKIKEKYIQMYNKFIMQLLMHTKTIRILAKGYLPVLLITPLKLKEILKLVKQQLEKQLQTMM